MINLNKAVEKQNNQVSGKRSTILWRLLKLVASTSPLMLISSTVAIILTAAANVLGSLFIERLINTYIIPLTKEARPDFGPLLHAIAVMFGC